MKVGVIGTGVWGIQVAKKSSDIGYPVSYARGNRNRDQLPGVFFGDAHNVLKNSDAVLICAPPKYQAGLTIRAANAGKHVFVEKPFAATWEEAQAVKDAVISAGIVFSTGHLFCYSDRVDEIISKNFPFALARITRPHPRDVYNPYWYIGIHYISLFQYIGIKRYAVEILYDNDFPGFSQAVFTNGFEETNWHATGDCLGRELEDFFSSIENNQAPKNNIHRACKVIKYLSDNYGNLYDGCITDANVEKDKAYDYC